MSLMGSGYVLRLRLLARGWRSGGINRQGQGTQPAHAALVLGFARILKKIEHDNAKLFLPLLRLGGENARLRGSAACAFERRAAMPPAVKRVEFVLA